MSKVTLNISLNNEKVNELEKHIESEVLKGNFYSTEDAIENMKYTIQKNISDYIEIQTVVTKGEGA